MAIRSVIKESCIGCGQCVRSCPADVFILDSQSRKAVVRYPEDCQLCMWCLSLCPTQAIDITNEPRGPVFTSWG